MKRGLNRESWFGPQNVVQKSKVNVEGKRRRDFSERLAKRMSRSQNERLRRALTKEGNALTTETEKLFADLKQPGNQLLREQLEKSNNFYEKIKGTKDTELYCRESSHMTALSKVAFDRVSEFRMSNSYTLDSFSTRLPEFLKSKCEESPSSSSSRSSANEHWKCLSSYANSAFFSSVSVPPLFSITKTPKERTQRQRANDREVAPQITPSKPSEADDSQGTVERIGEIDKILKKEKKVNFFDFVVDSESFTQTVENLFHFSFLVKEGHASLQVDEKNDVYVESKEKPKQDESSQSRAKRQQCVIALDEDTWRQIVAKRNLASRPPKIPHRDYRNLTSHGLQSRELDGSRKRERASSQREEGEREEEVGVARKRLRK